MRNNQWYGCRPDTKDHNDLHMTALATVIVPPAVDLREWCVPPMDQGALGSCTAHGVTGAARFHIRKRGTTDDFPMSRLQLYYDSRASEGSTASDAGAEIRDVIKTLATKGVGHEDLWPYDLSRWADAPPSEVYDDAVQYKALVYRRVPVNAMNLKQTIAMGHPVVIGVSVYDSFESEQTALTGDVPVPRHSENMVGGHCMLVVGYGQRPGTFTVRNSWGADWGDKGDCYMPEEYLGNSSFGSDYWVVDLFGSDAEKAAGRA